MHRDHRHLHQDDQGYGMWTEAFEHLHTAVPAGAPAVEVEQLAAAALDELLAHEEQR